MAIVCRRVRSCTQMEDTFLSTPVVYLRGGEFIIISNKGGEAVGCLNFKKDKSGFKHRGSFIFGAEGNGPYKGREVINYIH